MDEIEKFKAFFGSAADSYSDAQVRQLHREMHAMAELLLDIYLYGQQRDKTKASLPDFDRLPPTP